MAYAHVQSASAASTATVTATLGATPTSGNLLTALLSISGNSTATTPTGWTLVTSIATGSSGGGATVFLYVKIAGASESTSLSITFQRGTGFLFFSEWSGGPATVTGIAEATNTSVGSATSGTTGQVSTTTAGCLVIAGFAKNGTAAYTNAPTNSFTQTIAPPANPSGEEFYRALTGTTTNLDTTESWGGAAVSFATLIAALVPGAPPVQDVSSSDAATCAESITGIAVPSTDAGTSSEAVGVGATSASSDSAVSAETTGLLISSSQSATSAEASSSTATSSSSETGVISDSGSILLAGADSAIETDVSTAAAAISSSNPTTLIDTNVAAISVPSNDAATGTDTASSTSTRSSSDTAVVADTSYTLSIAGSDTATSTQTEVTTAAIVGTDSGTSTDVYTLRLANTDTAVSTEGTALSAVSTSNETAVSGDTTYKLSLTSSQSATWAETQSFAFASADAAIASDSAVVGPRSSDIGSSSEAASTSATVSSSDTGTGTQTAVSIGMVSSDAATSAQGHTVAAAITGSDAGLASDIGPSGNYVSLPGSAGNYVGMGAGSPVAGSIEFQVLAAPNFWGTPLPEYDLIAKWSFQQQSWAFNVTPGGFLKFGWSTTGSNAFGVTSTVALGLSPGQPKWCRCTVDFTNNVVRFYTSDDGVRWVQLGSNVSIAGGQSLFVGTSPILLGTQGLTGSTGFMSGKIFAARVYNGIGGALVADFASPGSGTSYTDSVGNVWTAHGTAAFNSANGPVGVTGQEAGVSTEAPAAIALPSSDAATLTELQMILLAALDAAQLLGIESSTAAVSGTDTAIGTENALPEGGFESSDSATVIDAELLAVLLEVAERAALSEIENLYASTLVSEAATMGEAAVVGLYSTDVWHFGENEPPASTDVLLAVQDRVLAMTRNELLFAPDRVINVGRE